MPLRNAGYPARNLDWLARGKPDIGSTGTALGQSTGVALGGASNLSPTQLTVDNAALTTGQIYYVGIPLKAGDVVTYVGCKVGATAGATLTNSFLALYGPTGTLLAQTTARQLTTITSGIPTATTAITALAANTVFAAPLGSAATPTPQTILADGWHYVAICVTGTTIPSLVGTALATTLCQGPVVGTVAASLTGNSYAAFIVKPGSAAGTAGNYFVDQPLAMLDASTATTTAPATITTNGAPSLSAKVPVVYAF